MGLGFTMSALFQKYEPLAVAPTDNFQESATLVYLPGANVPAEEYLPLMKSMQDEFRLHKVSLTCMIVKFPTLFGMELPTLWDPESMVKEALDSAGSAANAPLFLGGHSMGGILAQMMAFGTSPQFDYKGVLLHGSFIMDRYRGRAESVNIKIPALTVSGSRDGLNRLTYLAMQYKDLRDNEQYPQRSPAILIEGMNHMQIANSYSNDYTATRDLEPAILGENAIKLAASFSTSFLLQCIGREVELKELFNAMKKSEEKFFQPYIDAVASDENGQTCVRAQEVHFGKEASTRKIVSLKPYNQKSQRPRYAFSKPRGNETIVTVSTYVTRATTLMGRSSVPQAIQTLNCKLVSKEQIFGKESDNMGNCADINKAIVDELLSTLPRDVRSAYQSSSNRWNFGYDLATTSGLSWIMNDLDFLMEPKRISILTPKLHTAPGNGRYSGKLYCAFISKSRAIEHVFIDAHRPRPKLTKESANEDL